METHILLTMSEGQLRVLLKESIRELVAEERSLLNEPERLLSVLEAAALLNLAVATIYEKTSERTIPHYKHGKKVMFKKSELLAWVESGRVETLREVRKQIINKTISK